MTLTGLIIGIISGVITIGSLLWVLVKRVIIKPIKHHLRSNRVKRQVQLDQERHQQKIRNDQKMCNMLYDMINNQY